MSLTLAAIGAAAAALLNLTIAPFLRIGAAQPDFVLVCALIWTVAAGIEGGLVWAFIGGLMLDFLAPRPLGVSAFSLLLCVGGTALLARAVVRARYLIPPVAAMAFTIVNGLLLLVLYGALRGSVETADPLSLILPAAVYNTVLAALIGPLAVSVASRRENRERVDW
jgi:rod shape-determining protein MreD